MPSLAVVTEWVERQRVREEATRISRTRVQEFGGGAVGRERPDGTVGGSEALEGAQKTRQTHIRGPQRAGAAVVHRLRDVVDAVAARRLGGNQSADGAEIRAETLVLDPEGVTPGRAAIGAFEVDPVGPRRFGTVPVQSGGEPMTPCVSPPERRMFRSAKFCLVESGSDTFIGVGNMATPLATFCARPAGTPEINGSTKVLHAGLFGSLPFESLAAAAAPSGVGLATVAVVPAAAPGSWACIGAACR